VLLELLRKVVVCLAKRWSLLKRWRERLLRAHLDVMRLRLKFSCIVILLWRLKEIYLTTQVGTYSLSIIEELSVGIAFY
jgi:hypothetical protein